MKRRIANIVVLVIAASVVLAAVPLVRHWNSFVYPEQQIDLIFTHKVHKDEASCDECHTVNGDDERRMTIPDHNLCSDCHDIDAAEAGEDTDPPASCDTCHTAPITRETTLARPLSNIPPARLNFSHSVHADAEVKCGACHVGIGDSELATADHLPSMDTCMDCHRKQGKKNTCAACHTTEANGRLVTRSGGERFVPRGLHRSDRHDADWRQRHAKVAAANGETCLACHAETECSDCHAKGNSILVHPGNWLQAHAARAEMNQHRCQACHVVQEFCRDCHALQGLANATQRTDTARRSYHPSGWMSGQGPSSHAVAGRTQTSTCASCHEESMCIECHGSRTTLRRGGVSPHPPGFDAARLKRVAPESCVRCHRRDDPNLR